MSTVKLMSQDGQEFDVEKDVISMSVTVKNMLEDVTEMAAIPMPNIRSDILEKVLAYAKYHTTNKETPEEDKQKWDQDFVKVEQGTLFEMILAANYLDIKPMLDLTCKTVADMIKGKSPEEIRKMFNIPNDFTPEEEEQVRKENEWCEDR
eukprot:TRINITY_DN12894_c0_g1_i1.p1 TRINITY_DN12894_c0_g1~~TRINITY_DN12894_c0_g1_i1.p1  ORF type:complete len:150 (-),score=37.05 TRINITY_DN12894_c0_g1_i1:40-489(-)